MPQSAKRYSSRSSAERVSYVQEIRPRRDYHRVSAAKRGYDRQWRRLRAAILARFPLCQRCEAAGRVTPAEDVHHVIKVKDDRSRRLDPSNLMSVCRACHAALDRRSDRDMS